jgi:hypothetical protein
VRHEDTGFAFEQALDALVEDVGADFRVDCRERVVEQVDVSILVAGARESDALFLAAGDIAPRLANLRSVATCECMTRSNISACP